MVHEHHPVVSLNLYAAARMCPRSHDRVPTPNMGVRPYRINTGGLLQDAVERGTLRIGIERDYPRSATMMRKEG